MESFEQHHDNTVLYGDDGSAEILSLVARTVGMMTNSGCSSDYDTYYV